MPIDNDLLYTPIEDRDIDKLATVLHNEAVYEHIGGMPSRADFDLWLRRSIAGPPTDATGEHWINIAVRMAETGKVIGLLEANIHDELAEVAFLYSPKLWGVAMLQEACFGYMTICASSGL